MISFGSLILWPIQTLSLLFILQSMAHSLEDGFGWGVIRAWLGLVESNKCEKFSSWKVGDGTNMHLGDIERKEMQLAEDAMEVVLCMQNWKAAKKRMQHKVQLDSDLVIPELAENDAESSAQ